MFVAKIRIKFQMDGLLGLCAFDGAGDEFLELDRLIPVRLTLFWPCPGTLLRRTVSLCCTRSFVFITLLRSGRVFLLWNRPGVFYSHLGVSSADVRAQLGETENS